MANVLGPGSKYFKLVGQTLSVETTQPCHHSAKQPYVNERTWLCAHKTLFTKTGGQFADP